MRYPQFFFDERSESYLLKQSHLQTRCVNIHIGEEPVGILSAGLGANWHPPGQGREGFPAADDDVGWRKVFDAMTWCGIRWVRFWVDPDALPEPGCLDKDHATFRMLDRLEAWARATESSILLELGYPTPPYRFPAPHSAVSDPARYVKEYAAPILTHVLQERGIQRVRHFNFFNEPFNADGEYGMGFAAPEGVHPFDSYFRVVEELRKALDSLGEAGRQVSLSIPNSSSIFQRLPEVMDREGYGERLTRLAGAFDVHMWRARLSYMPPTHRWPTFTVSEGIEYFLRPILQHARRCGKEVVLTEFGGMYYNNDPFSLDVTRHDCFLTEAEVMVHAINEGVSGCMKWAFLSAGRSDGQWQWIDVPSGTYQVRPHLYYGFGTVMRYHEPGATILPLRVEDAPSGEFIHGGCITWNGNRQGTVWLINDHPVEYIRVKLRLPELADGGSRWRWWCKDPFYHHEPLGELEADRQHVLTLRPWSVNAISTKEGAGGPGGPDRSPKFKTAHESVPAVEINP